MKNCLHCSYDFSYSELMKANFKFDSGRIECPKCHQTNYISVVSNTLVFLLAFVPFELTMIILQLFDIKSWIVIPAALTALCLVILLSPYIIRFKKHPDGVLEEQFRAMERRKKSGDRIK